MARDIFLNQPMLL